MSSTPPAFLKGPINSTRKKRELLEIAGALGISTDGTVKALISRITAYLREHTELSTQPQFQGLFSYRPSKTGSNHGPDKAAGKTSIDKALEDEVQAAAGKDTEATGGAHKILVEAKISHDPPARHGLLTSGVNTPARIEARDALGTQQKDDRLLTPLSSPPQSEEPEQRPDEDSRGSLPAVACTPVKETRIVVPDDAEGQKTRSEMKTMFVDVRDEVTIVVAVKKHGDPDSATDEIYIPQSGALIQSRAVAGQREHYVKLSKLLPIAIKNASTPMKGPCPSNPSPLLPARPESPTPKRQRAPISRVDPSRGSQSVRSREVLEARAGSPQDHASLISFIRQLVDGPTGQWKKAKTVGDILQRCKAVDHAMAVMEELGWEKSKGGYQIPEGECRAPYQYNSRIPDSPNGCGTSDYADAGVLAGQTFVKEDILKALRLGHSQANSDANLFKKKVLDKLPELQAWYDDPAGPEGKRFRSMTVKEFEAFQEYEMRRLRRRKDSGKTRKQSDLSDMEDDSVARASKKHKKGKRAVREVESDDLDDSGSD
ncbi:hypothetical protein NUW54_g7662 [Trametes sanguinea]|uniref:Uncharacterized protein n=1 Tax=Trametes sanguinea TaxID=158606 RepID=A0ACC1PKQ8_9APHY|nr:hypothetical protein NUW54_g7662 [Trametes sanguinea]